MRECGQVFPNLILHHPQATSATRAGFRGAEVVRKRCGGRPSLRLDLEWAAEDCGAADLACRADRSVAGPVGETTETDSIQMKRQIKAGLMEDQARRRKLLLVMVRT
jgi:hypothetical protein